MLPRDILYTISLYLPIYKLAINRETFKFYDKRWYQQVLGTTSLCSYRELYGRYRQEGQIYSFEVGKLIGYGLQAAATIGFQMILRYNGVLQEAPTIGSPMILRYNGNLYLKDILLATNVLIIDSYTYITSTDSYYCWYQLTADYKKVLLKTSSEPFISLAYHSDFLIAATTNTVYVKGSALRFWSIPNIKKLVLNGDHILILDNEGKIKTLLTSEGRVICHNYKQVIDIMPGVVFFEENSCQTYKFATLPYSGLQKLLLGYYCEYNNIIASINHKYLYLLLSNKTVIWCNYTIIATNVKSICGNSLDLFFIR